MEVEKNIKITANELWNLNPTESVYVCNPSRATLNDKKISVKKANKLKDSLILTGSSASRNQERADKIFGNMQEVVMNPCLGNFDQNLWSL